MESNSRLRIDAAAQQKVQKRYMKRMRETYSILQAIDPSIADEVFNQNRETQADPKTSSAIKIQKLYRGFKARKLYKELLYEMYVSEIDQAREEELRRMEESMLMIENMKLEEEIKEKQFYTRQNMIERTWAATTIQRKYRQFKNLQTPTAVLPSIASMAKPRFEESIHLPILGDLTNKWLDYLEEKPEQEDKVFTKRHNVSFTTEPPQFPLSDRVLVECKPREDQNTAIDLGRMPIVLKTYSEARQYNKKDLLARATLLTRALQECSEVLKEELEERDAMSDKIKFSKRLIEYLVKIMNKNIKT